MISTLLDNPLDTSPAKQGASPKEKQPEQRAPKWYERFMPPFSFQGLGDAFSATFYFSRLFMYQFEVAYQYLAQRLSDLQTNRVVDGKTQKVKIMQEAALSLTRKVKKFIGRDYSKTIEVTDYCPVRGIRVRAAPHVLKELDCGPYTPLKQGWKTKLFSVLPILRDIPGIRPAVDVDEMATYVDEVRAGTKITPGKEGSSKLYFGQEWPFKDRLSPQSQGFLLTRNLINILEAIVFGTIDLIGYFGYRREMVKDLRDTIHLDTGTAKDVVSKAHLNRSSNPFIQSELSQNRWKYALRFIGDAAFVWGLKTGIILKLLPYPLEYTVFREKTSFRALKQAVKDLQTNHLGAEAEQAFSLDVLRSVQQSLREHRRPALSGAALKDYKREVIDPIATLAVAERISLGEIIHVLGDVLSSETRLRSARGKLEKLAQAKAVALAPGAVGETSLSPAVKSQEQERTEQPRSPARDAILARKPGSFLSAASGDGVQLVPAPSH